MNKMNIVELTIDNYKCFMHLHVKNIGTFNLIVGANGVGKTSLLEACMVMPTESETLRNMVQHHYFTQIKFAPHNWHNHMLKPIKFSAKTDSTSYSVEISYKNIYIDNVPEYNQPILVQPIDFLRAYPPMQASINKVGTMFNATLHTEILKILQEGAGVYKTLAMLKKIEISERIIVENIDSDIHYSNLKAYFKLLAVESFAKKVQVFGTTHSYECLQAFCEAMQELGTYGDWYAEGARVILLEKSRKTHETVAYSYKFDEIEHATTHHIEIR